MKKITIFVVSFFMSFSLFSMERAESCRVLISKRKRALSFKKHSQSDSSLIKTENKANTYTHYIRGSGSHICCGCGKCACRWLLKPLENTKKKNEVTEKIAAILSFKERYKDLCRNKWKEIKN